MLGSVIRQNYRTTQHGLELNEIVDGWHEFLQTALDEDIISKGMYNRYNEANFAVAKLLISSTCSQISSKLFYSCSQINDTGKLEGFNYVIQEANKKKLDTTKALQYYNNLVVKTNKNYFSTIKVDVFRSINLSTCRYRYNDCEYIILSNIAAYCRKNKINIFSIQLFTYLEPCLSCDNVIIDFVKMFPDSEIQLYYKQVYNKAIT